MEYPTFDKNGYPTDETLGAIRQWDAISDLKGLLPFAEEAFVHRFGKWQKIGNTIRAVTGGWSGCESVVDALADNFIFWTTCWILTRRGGLFLFEIPSPEEGR